MADLSYESFLNSKPNNTVKNNGLSYDSYVASKNNSLNITAQRDQRIKQGLPVSNNPNRVNPTMAGSFLRDPLHLIAKTATNLINTEQVIRGVPKTQPFSGKYLGKVAPIGDGFDVTQGLTKNNVSALKDSAGTGLDIASYLVGGGEAKTASSILKLGVKDFAKANGARLLKEGIAMGLTQSTGSQLEDTGTINLKKTLIDTGVSTVLVPVLAFGLNRLLGKNAVKVVENMDKGDIENFIQKDVPNLQSAAEKHSAYAESQGYKPYTPDNQLPTIDAGATPKSGLPTIQTQPEPSSTGSYKYEPTTGQPTSPETPAFNPVTGEPIQSTPKFDTTSGEPINTNPETPNVPKIDSTIVAEKSKALDDIPEFNSKTKLAVTNTYESLRQSGQDNHILDVATGKVADSTLPRTAAYKLLASDLQKEALNGSDEVISKLKDLVPYRPSVIAQTGQDLSMVSLGTKNDITEVLADINKSRAKTAGISEEAVGKETATYAEKLKQTFKDLSDTIINKLICK